MAKVNNAVRIVEFETESDLYLHLENDLVSYFNDPDSRCYKLKNIQLLDKNHAILYFEEDMNTIMVRFIFNGELLCIGDAPYTVDYFSLQEISLLDELGLITIEDTEYEIENIEYAVFSDSITEEVCERYLLEQGCQTAIKWLLQRLHQKKLIELYNTYYEKSLSGDTQAFKAFLEFSDKFFKEDKENGLTKLLNKIPDEELDLDSEEDYSYTYEE